MANSVDWKQCFRWEAGFRRLDDLIIEGMIRRSTCSAANGKGLAAGLVCRLPRFSRLRAPFRSGILMSYLNAEIISHRGWK